MAKYESQREVQQKIEWDRLAGKTTLSLSRVFFKGMRLELPKSLGEFTDLRSLDISDNDLTELPDWLGNLTHLHVLNVSANRLTVLPDWIGNLTELQALDISGNNLSGLPPLLGGLVKLEELGLSTLGLTAIPPWLGNLTALRWLRISDNQLTTVPDIVGTLHGLERLDFAYNQLRSVPDALGTLTKLHTLNLHGNRLTAIPDTFCQLRALKTLSLTNNPIQVLPEQLGALRKLRSLTLANTQIRVLPESFRRLRELRFLALSGTLLATLPEWFGELKALKGLDLSNGVVSVITWEDNARSWSISGGSRMHPGFLRLPPSLTQLSNLKELYLHGNRLLDLPVEVLGPSWDEVNRAQGRKRAPRPPANILSYYFRTLRGGRPLNEAKLILVGRGGVGKTSVINRLIHGTFDEREKETPGIEIQSWQVTLPEGDRVRLHVWDFGGQEILHATHQFFLTERTLYLLVLSGREGTATHDAEYWLQLIRSFGADSPVIIVLNKSRQHPFDVNRGMLLEKYPQIAAFVVTDCQHTSGGEIAPKGGGAMGTDKLRNSVLDATSRLDHRKADFPSDWFDIKERLAGMKENFVTWDEYREICRGFGENDSKAQRDLAGFLHVLGIALNYRDDPRLRDTHVLNPRWVTEGIYSILRRGQHEKPERQGVLDINDLARALKPQDYPRSSHEFLLALMEKFQLCFSLPGEPKRYLVPELLGENQPAEIQSLLASPGLGFRYQYEVLPHGLLPRFIVQTHVHSQSTPTWRWRTGVVLSHSDSRAVVRADARERRVDIHISGPERQRRDLLAIIRDRLDEQHRDLKGLTVDQRVPVPAESGVSVSYDFLVRLEDEGERWVRPEGAGQKYLVADLLNGIESPDRRADRDLQGLPNSLKRRVTAKHVFLSYCHDNSDEVECLRNDLIVAGATVWWDQDIMPGQDWKLMIDLAIRDAYIVVLCLSKESEARSDSGIYPEALNAISALREHAPGGIFLIPVRLSECTIPPIEIDATRRLNRLQFVDLFPDAQRAAGVAKLIAAIRSALHS